MDDWRTGTIVRIWRGRAIPAGAEIYVRHVTERVFPSLTGNRGHRGAYLLRCDTEGQVEFLVITLWESMHAIREFAGEQVDRAVVEPEARAALVEYDDFVRHFELIHRSRSE